nr:fatty acid amide hydrolase-like [Ipomoea batatas]
MYYHMEIFKNVDVIVTPTTGMTAPIIPPSALSAGETDMQVSGWFFLSTSRHLKDSYSLALWPHSSRLVLVKYGCYNPGSAPDHQLKISSSPSPTLSAATMEITSASTSPSHAAATAITAGKEGEGRCFAGPGPPPPLP